MSREWSSFDDEVFADMCKFPTVPYEAVVIHTVKRVVSEQLSDTLLPAIERASASIAGLADSLEGLLRDEYEEAGRPLGECDDAMHRWAEMRAELWDQLPEQTSLSVEEEEAWVALAGGADEDVTFVADWELWDGKFGAGT